MMLACTPSPLSEAALQVQACNLLGGFLTHKETNLRYLSLEGLCNLASSEFSHEAVKKHQETVLNALKASEKYLGESVLIVVRCLSLMTYLLLFQSWSDLQHCRLRCFCCCCIYRIKGNFGLVQIFLYFAWCLTMQKFSIQNFYHIQFWTSNLPHGSVNKTMALHQCIKYF